MAGSGWKPHSAGPRSQNLSLKGPYMLTFRGLTMISGETLLLKSGKGDYPSLTTSNSPLSVAVSSPLSIPSFSCPPHLREMS